MKSNRLMRKMFDKVVYCVPVVVVERITWVFIYIYVESRYLITREILIINYFIIYYFIYHIYTLKYTNLYIWVGIN